MIVRMLHLDLVAPLADREATLERLRSLGAVHLDLAAAGGSALAAVKGEAADAERAVQLILKAGKGQDCEIEKRPHSVAEVLALAADREKLQGALDELEREIRCFEPYGDFDPELARRLQGRVEGLAEVVTLPERLPAMRLSKMHEKAARLANRIRIDTAKLAGCDETAIVKSFPEIADRIAFAAARELMAEHGSLAVISGWVPQNRLAEFKAAAATAAWGFLLREAAPGENPPTLVEPPRIFRPVISLFRGLGVAVGYTEADVSVPFMCYFSLFFAMLVGDGAYGVIFLIATLALRRKIGRSWFVLMTVFSLATIAWGTLSNTWFGAQLPFAKSWPTVTWLADPSYNHMMLLCFTIGVSQLVLARLWNFCAKINDTTALAELGWAGVLVTMYLVTNSIVGIFSGFPVWGYYLGGVAIALVFLFTVKPSELRTRGAELGMLPLNIMSALGDIISYVRLFAVGLASVKVAENFNVMATDLVAGAGEWWVKALLSLAMVAILVFGHVLNLMMAALSVLVHAVRLNTLEFSNHKGISWSGYDYRPFARNLS